MKTKGELMERLFTATAHGEDWIAFKDARDVLWTLDKNGNIQPIVMTDVTNLQPVQIAKAGDVVIEETGGWDLREIISNAQWITKEAGYGGVAIRLSEILAQLSPPAKENSLVTAYEDSRKLPAKERQHLPSKDCWCGPLLSTAKDKVTGAVPEPSKGVWIELSEEEAKELVAYSKGTVIRDKIIARVYEKANQIVAQTPAEPKEETPSTLDIGIELSKSLESESEKFFAQIAESLERLADIEEYKLRRTDRNFGTMMSVKDLLNDNRIIINPKEGA